MGKTSVIQTHKTAAFPFALLLDRRRMGICPRIPLVFDWKNSKAMKE